MIETEEKIPRVVQYFDIDLSSKKYHGDSDVDIDAGADGTSAGCDEIKMALVPPQLLLGAIFLQYHSPPSSVVS